MIVIQSHRTYDHVPIVTLVRDEGVEGDGVEHHPPVSRVLWYRAAHGWNIVTGDFLRGNKRENVITGTLR